MAKLETFLLQLFFSGLFLALSSATTNEDRQVYVVYMGSLPSLDYMAESHHQNILQEIVEGSPVEDVLVRSYKRSFNGFAAKLSEKEKQKLESKKGIVSIFPRRNYQLHTTRSWDFMGLTQNVTRKPTVESDIVIGMLDTGVWPDSPSFNDKGFSPPPEKWKGVCKGGRNFTCNNKIVGARAYITDSAVDELGHGTHTASTAAGNPVESVSFFGLAEGTARGGVPSARLATYAVCGTEGCTNDAILAGFDDAIADGVDIISISVGGNRPYDFEEDPVSIGAFHASKRGVLVVHSAGNSGPDPGSTSSTAPWLLTVAASSTDRLITDKVVLGNGKTIAGYSVNTFDLKGKKFPLITDQNDGLPECSTWQCKQQSTGLKGKILVSYKSSGTLKAFEAGAAGVIVESPQDYKVSQVTPLPKSVLGVNDFDVVLSYVAGTRNPTGSILRSEVITDSTAPAVAYFSSRGPNPIVPGILKPDLTGPGVAILAAYSIIAPLSQSAGEKRHADYNIMSGTSMACPHVAGVAAYVKTFHPDWSPSAIKSALMTTSWPMKSTANPDGEFAYGSGHIDPIKATDPGLVYESSTEDYMKFLCGIGYIEERITQITGSKVTCPQRRVKDAVKNLNYPSLAAKVPSTKSFKISFNRTVTNVGPASSTYKVKISSIHNTGIEVIPEVLSFKSVGEKLSFVVTVSELALGGSDSEMSGSLVWSDGVHNVRSPIILF